MNSASARSLLIALGAGIFFAEGIWVLYNGHLSDDALILYTYVNNLAAGHGIVYRPGAGPAEGATDFLWMVLLTGLVKAGLDGATRQHRAGELTVLCRATLWPLTE